MKNSQRFLLLLVCLHFSGISGLQAEEQSVRPGINTYFMDPDWQQWVNRFERPGREIYDRRFDILRASALSPGMDVAHIGAGTGLFTRLFVENILYQSREQGLMNIEGVVNSPGDTMLEEGSIDLAFTVDTYHHFEYPQSMLASIHKALRSGGRLIVVDFRKQPGASSDWVMKHVRASREKVIEEITAAGFVLIDDKPFLRANYFLVFRKAE